MLTKRRNIIDEILQGSKQRLNAKYFEKNHSNVYDVIIKHSLFLENKNLKFKEKVWYWASNKKKDILCKTCGENFPKFKNNWLEGYKIYCSTKCLSNDKDIKDKRKETNLERYGSENVFQNEDIKDKIKQTNLERYGVEHATQNKDIKDKRKQTNLERYGVENVTQNKDIKDKRKQTNLERYGVEYITQNKEIYDKIIQTNLERYGVEHVTQNKEIYSKVKQTNLERYGVEHAIQNKEIYDKIIQTNLERYGVEHAIQNKEIYDKFKQTNLERYGVDNYSKTKECRNKVKASALELYIKKYSDLCIENPKLNKDYKFVSYNNNNIDLYHNKCLSINSIPSQLLYSRLKYNLSEICIYCNPLNSTEYTISLPEIEIKEYVEKLNIDYVKNDRDVLDGKELDIYIPSHNLAIEFNGLYWHSEANKHKNYHLDKSNKCSEKDIQLIHIFEDDWNDKQDIVKSIIKNKLGKIEDKIYARKCIIKEVKSNIVREFLNKNHIQGFSRSKYKLGLYYNNELVSLMTFGYRRTNTKKEFELIRFCNKINTNIVGASSKLFKHFINNYYIEEDYILSYADASMFDGQMYKTLGFEYIHRTLPNYFWIVNKKREHRFKYNKQKLIKEGYDPNMTEVEIMHSRNHYRIYGVGQDRYEYILKK